MPNDTIDEPTAPTGDRLRIGVIGLGHIGRGIVLSLANNGRTSSVFDTHKDAAAGLNAVWLDSAEEVARSSDIVFVSVVDAKQVIDVVTGSHGVLAGAHPGLVTAVVSTIAVKDILDLAEECRRYETDLVDCGVTGGQKAAENGLNALVGGPDEVLQRIKPVLEDFADRVYHCGSLGMGMATKVARNVVTYGCWRAVHEAVELAQASGVDPATFIDVIENSGTGRDARLTLQKMRLSGRTVDNAGLNIRIYLRNMEKDLDAARQLGIQTRTAVPLVEVALEESSDTFKYLGEVCAKKQRNKK